MGLSKGQTNNPNGRPKGTPNKVTTEIRQGFQTLIENNFEQLEQDIKSLEPKDRVKSIIELSKFVLPTLKATELSAKEDKQVIPNIIVSDKETKREIDRIFEED